MFVFVSSTVWDDSSHARCVQREGRHVQAAAAARSRCQLQPARARIHGAHVRWPVRRVSRRHVAAAVEYRPPCASLKHTCSFEWTSVSALREDRHYVDDAGRRGRNRRDQLSGTDRGADGSFCWLEKHL